MSASLATAFVMVKAITTGFSSDLKKELKSGTAAAGAAGADAGGAFSKSLGSKMQAGIKSLSKVGVAAFAGIAIASVDGGGGTPSGVVMQPSYCNPGTTPPPGRGGPRDRGR